jgi:hypothetical protein
MSAVLVDLHLPYLGGALDFRLIARVESAVKIWREESHSRLTWPFWRLFHRTCAPWAAAFSPDNAKGRGPNGVRCMMDDFIADGPLNGFRPLPVRILIASAHDNVR